MVCCAPVALRLSVPNRCLPSHARRSIQCTNGMHQGSLCRLVPAPCVWLFGAPQRCSHGGAPCVRFVQAGELCRNGAVLKCAGLLWACLGVRAWASNHALAGAHRHCATVSRRGARAVTTRAKGSPGGGVMDRPTISVPGIDIGCAWPVRELVLMCWCLRKWVSVSGHPVHCQWSRGECALIRRRFSRRKDTQKKRPRFYRVMLHNDSYNRREYVVQVLMKTIPGMTVDDAVNIMQARACSPAVYSLATLPAPFFWRRSLGPPLLCDLVARSMAHSCPRCLPRCSSIPYPDPAVRSRFARPVQRQLPQACHYWAPRSLVSARCAGGAREWPGVRDRLRAAGG